MTRLATALRLLCCGIAALALAGCASTGEGGAGLKPKAVVVTDFLFSSDVAAVDRGYTARLEQKIGHYPAHERKQRTNERVNDEIVAVIIATLREAGLDAQPGTLEGLTLTDNVVVVGGRVRPLDEANAAKNKTLGFGGGRGGVAADMTVSHISSGGKNQILAFTMQMPGKSPALDRKQAAARNAAIEAALDAEGTPAVKVKLSADTESQARRLGRAIGDKLLAFARERTWLASVESATPEPATAEPAVRVPPHRPQPKPGGTPKPKPRPTLQSVPQAAVMPQPKPKAAPQASPEPAAEPPPPAQTEPPPPQQDLQPQSAPPLAPWPSSDKPGT